MTDDRFKFCVSTAAWMAAGISGAYAINPQAPIIALVMAGLAAPLPYVMGYYQLNPRNHVALLEQVAVAEQKTTAAEQDHTSLPHPPPAPPVELT